MQTRMTVQEWRAKAAELFGDDPMKWRFVCPCCKHVQTAEDFRPFKDQGATPDTARFNCIGRYVGAKREAFGEGPGPCNYTSGGLFCLGPVTVIDEEGEERVSFAFASTT